MNIFQSKFSGHNPPAIMAHRGASYDAPENTIAAFERAISLGADWIEFDVRRTRDGVLIVHHNPRINGRDIAGETLQYLHSLPGQTEIPTFAQVLALACNTINMNIEIKELGFETQILSEMRTYHAENRVLITSFHDQVIHRIKELDGRICTGLIIGRRLFDQMPHNHVSDVFPLSRIAACQANVLVINIWLARQSLIQQAHRRGIAVAVWTVDDPVKLSEFMHRRGVDAIITNRPDLALEIRQKTL